MNKIQETRSLLDDFAGDGRLPYHRNSQTRHEGLAEALAKSMGIRDPGLLAHSLGVANFATKVARRLGLPEEKVDIIRRGSLLHDIGKLGVPQEFLSKPSRLTDREYAAVRTHPLLGAALLQDCPEYKPLIPIVRHHHEHFNGGGYPDRIAGEEIEIEARIVAVSETVTTMATDEPYRKSQTARSIIKELRNNSGIKFDPVIADAAIKIIRESKSSKKLGAPVNLIG